MEEKILCAAVWYDDGKKYSHQPKNIETGFVILCYRHEDYFAWLGEKFINHDECIELHKIEKKTRFYY